MKHLLLIIFSVIVATPLMANVQDEANLELDQMVGRGWYHIGCVNQTNGASICLRKARLHGYNQARVQQDYVCDPRVFYSCYGLVTGTTDALSDLDADSSRASCGGYVKPATCNSHRECKWVGSCVPR